MTKTYDRYIECQPGHFMTRCVERGHDLEKAMACVTKKDENTWIVDIQHPAYPVEKSGHMKELEERAKKAAKGGVGTELKKMLKMIGITASPTCGCNAKSRRMDELGIQWCKDNVETVVLWLKEEANKRKLPFAKFVGRKLVHMAIKRAEKKLNG